MPLYQTDRAFISDNWLTNVIVFFKIDYLFIYFGATKSNSCNDHKLT